MEEIKQKDKLKDGFEDLVINDTGKNFDDDMFIIQDWWLKQFDSLLSQALQKRDKTFLEILEDNRKETMWAEKSDQEVSDQGITDFIDAVKIKLSTLTTK